MTTLGLPQREFRLTCLPVSEAYGLSSTEIDTLSSQMGSSLPPFSGDPAVNVVGDATLWRIVCKIAAILLGGARFMDSRR